jgi:hypothetical protein
MQLIDTLACLEGKAIVKLIQASVYLVIAFDASRFALITQFIYTPANAHGGQRDHGHFLEPYVG